MGEDGAGGQERDAVFGGRKIRGGCGGWEDEDLRVKYVRGAWAIRTMFRPTRFRIDSKNNRSLLRLRPGTCYVRSMLDEKADSVVYRSDTANGLVGWDVMEVVYLRAKQVVGSFFIARHRDGTILRRFADGTIILKNKWEEVTDQEDLRRYQKCFDDRDRAAAEI